MIISTRFMSKLDDYATRYPREALSESRKRRRGCAILAANSIAPHLLAAKEATVLVHCGSDVVVDSWILEFRTRQGRVATQQGCARFRTASQQIGARACLPGCAVSAARAAKWNVSYQVARLVSPAQSGKIALAILHSEATRPTSTCVVSLMQRCTTAIKIFFRFFFFFERLFRPDSVTICLDWPAAWHHIAYRHAPLVLVLE